MSQNQLVELFLSSKSNISEHIKNIFKEGELQETSVVRDFRITAKDGKISHKQAMEKAKKEYKEYKTKTLSEVEKSYLENINTLEKTAKKKVKEKYFKSKN